MAEVLWVLAMLLLIGAFGAIRLVPWVDILWVGKTLMLDSAALGVPLELVYFLALGGALTWTGRRPRGWYWRPFLHHHLLTARQRVVVLPWYVTGALAFVGIVFGIAVTVLGMIAAAVQSR
jgi:hypothetical protein